MTNLWVIIGWSVLFVVTSLIMLAVLSFALAWLIVERRWKQDRDTPPAAGQTWEDGPDEIEIERIAGNGDICWSMRGRYGQISMCERPADWRQRVYLRKMLLKRGAWERADT